MARPRLVNTVMAADLAADRCSRAQMTAILHANLAGEGFDLGSTTVWEERRVRDLLERPTLDRDALTRALPGGVAVIVRQGGPVPTDPDRDPTRAWYGVDALAPDGGQRLASSRWWRFQEHRRATVDHALAVTGRVPLLVSVGGYLHRGYDITGWDHQATRAHADRGGTGWAFTLAPGRPDWAARVEGHWLNSGPGGPLVMWVLA